MEWQRFSLIAFFSFFKFKANWWHLYANDVLICFDKEFFKVRFTFCLRDFSDTLGASHSKQKYNNCKYKYCCDFHLFSSSLISDPVLVVPSASPPRARNAAFHSSTVLIYRTWKQKAEACNYQRGTNGTSARQGLWLWSPIK